MGRLGVARGVTGSAAIVVVSFVAGLALQVVATEAVVLRCLATGVDERWIGIGLATEVAAIFAYMLVLSLVIGPSPELSPDPPTGATRGPR